MALKVYVTVKADVWRSFKAIAAERGATVQDELGKLVEHEVRAERRRQAQRLGRSKAAKQAMDKALQELREGGS